ncbi:MAG: 4Fe-4S binding protein [Sphaerochaeta sp.]|uniref:ATP-binding protein n=1 Tax=Sphaerochaeta sp. TaxID=1972642 RepID=UPI002585CBCB|nr:4Fe-4S binding protein [Sphaerochaeta sp.]MDD2395763.1 4Fe-4S binding protein [Sphaerochaeta sp.]MDD4037209.1 4Fe-4S binding protein [Sphaerochaeta sp.]
MIRQMITIDEEKCNGCGLCVSACQEGAIGLVNGKAVLLREDYCDGLGNCLPVCPTGAITFEEREAPAFNHEAVEEFMQANKPVFSCPGSQIKVMKESQRQSVPSSTAAPSVSQLRQWPVQIKLAAPNAAFFNNCDLLIAADCAAYAHGDFHNTFIRNRVTLIGCPKLDEGDYAQKLTQIFSSHDIRSVTVARMEVPCCGGLDSAVKRAIAASGKIIPLAVVTISTEGEILR